MQRHEKLSGYGVLLWVWIFTAALAFSDRLAAATGPEIEGHVKDVFGRPVQDVNVSIENSRFQARTDAGGHYHIPYVPGQFTLVISKRGYTTHRIPLSLSGAARFPMQDVVVYPIPQVEGIYYR